MTKEGGERGNPLHYLFLFIYSSIFQLQLSACEKTLLDSSAWEEGLEVAALSLTLAKAQLQRLILSLVMSSWMEIISE